jgi:hypothetical protein
MCSGRGDEQLRSTGFPIRKSSDQCLVADFPRLIAGSNVLLRLLVPRHPPCALINLATTIDARVHCAVLKIRAVPVRSTSASAVGRAGPRVGSTPDPSGPNSVLDQAAPPPPFRPEGRTNWLELRAGRITSAPLVSSHLGTFAQDMALGTTSVEAAPVAP